MVREDEWQKLRLQGLAGAGTEKAVELDRTQGPSPVGNRESWEGRGSHWPLTLSLELVFNYFTSANFVFGRSYRDFSPLSCLVI